MAHARHIASEITETEKALRDLIQAPFPFEDFINLVAESNLADKIRDCTTRLSAVRKQRDILARLQLDPLSAPALPDVFLKVLSKSVAQLSAETEEKVRAHVRRLDHRGETWVRQGLGYVKDDRLCPFCGQDTAGTSLLALYSGFFSNAYREHVVEIERASNLLDQILGDGALASAQKRRRRPIIRHKWLR